MARVFGRSEQLAVLDGALSDVLAGRGRLLVVTGEAGIGKSTLGETAMERAAVRGLTTARGYAVDEPGAPVLWPWWKVARRLPQLHDVLATVGASDLDDDAARFRVCEAVSAALVEAAQPTGLQLLLEDLHWADSLSVAVLRHLAFDLAAAPIAVVATAREAPLTAWGRALPDLLRSPSSTAVPLHGLGVEAVTDWLTQERADTGWVSLAGDLVRRTDGNPFYIRSLVSQGPAQSADGIDRLLASRSGLREVLVAPYLRLPAETRHTLATAALLAERLSPTLLAAATGQSVSQVSDDITAGVRAGVLQHGTTGISFVHALVREVVAAHTTAYERELANAAIAVAMEATQDDLLIGPSAVHWDRAAGTEASVHCRDQARLAAASAAKAHAHEEAVYFARMSLRHARATGAQAQDLAERLIELARYEWMANVLPEALASCVEAVDVAEACGRADLMAQAALVPQGIGSIDVSRVVDGLCRRALAQLGEEDLATRARLTGLRAVAAGEEAAADAAAALSISALDLARRSGSAQAELEAIAARHFVVSYPQALDERIMLAGRAVHLGRTSSTALGVLWGHLWQADIALQRGDLGALEVVTNDIGRVARERSSPVGRWHELRLLALRAALVGSFEQSRSYGGAGHDIAERIGDTSMVGMYFALRLMLAQLRGDPDEIPDAVLPLLEQAPPIPLVAAAFAQALLLRGERDAARSAFEGVRSAPDRMPLGPRWAGTVGQVGWVAALLGDAEVAQRCHHLLAPTAHWYGADGGGAPFSHGSNEYLLGVMALAYGDVLEAHGHFQRAAEANIRLGARPYVALARLGGAQCVVREPGLAEGPASTSARELVAAAAGELRRLDMPGPLEQAEQLLAGMTSPVGQRERLTPREGEVARLVGQALTNQQIAGRLFLSVRTVESHVRSALAKLQLSTRTELALWVRQHMDR